MLFIIYNDKIIIEVILINTDIYDDNEKVVLLFSKNRIGEFTYSVPVVVKHAYGEYMRVVRGFRKNYIIPMNKCLDSKGLLSKVTSKEKCSVTLKGRYNLGDSLILGIILDSEIEKFVFDSIRNEKDREPTDQEFILYLILFGDIMGRTIDKIDQTIQGFSISLNGKYGTLQNRKEIVRKTFFNQPKSAIAEVDSGENSRIADHSDEREILQEEEMESQQSMYTDSDAKRENSEILKSDVAELKARIREKVIGQDRAIDVIVNNIYFNQRYIDTGERDLLRNKANIILDGSTGTGKTFILEEVAQELKLPIYVSGVTNYSSVGYKGADLTDILRRLLEKANGNLDLAERGIVVFDEFDKLGGSTRDDISMRKALQQELLTFISGNAYDVSYKGRTYHFDTSKLTFIGMGAFTNLRERKIRENEKKYKSTIGFSQVNETDIERIYTISKDDYVQEGLERELVGRFSCLTYTNDLSIGDLERILTESTTSPLIGLQITGNIMGCNIEVSPDIIHEIAQRAFDTNTGARGLIEIVQSLKDIIANDLFLEKEKLVITREHLDKIKCVHERAYQTRKVY